MKILILSIVFISSVFAQTTLCYNENSKENTISKTLMLDGGECKGNQSILTMLEDGWKLEYSQVSKAQQNYKHLYIFKKKDIAPPTKEEKLQARAQKQAKLLDLEQKETVINGVSNNSAKIKIGNLKIGQSGIIIHNYENDELIVGTATVTSSSASSSTISINKSVALTQNAIPTSTRTVQNGDTFVLNHMYNSSLLLTPNFEVSQEVKSIYPKQNFLNPDLFAAFLKIEKLPVPKPKDLRKFCQDNDIGTIFIAVNNRLFILDTNSFKILNEVKLNTISTQTQTPFFTKVTGISKSFWNFSDKKIYNYNNYYLAIVHNKEIIQNKANDNEEETNSDPIKRGLSKIWNMLPSW